jgi:transcriptional regulator
MRLSGVTPSLDPTPDRYLPASEAAVVDLVRTNPFAWVVEADAAFAATPLPLCPEVDETGRLVALIGHFARSNPQVARLRAEPRVRLLFMGPHAYVSPSWLSDRTQAPTWNYASAVFDCEISWLETPEETEGVLGDLVEAMEADRPQPWSMAEMGKRYQSLSRGVVGFRADIRDRRVVFKLGQDEPDALFPQILHGLEQDGHADVADWMRRERR